MGSVKLLTAVVVVVAAIVAGPAGAADPPLVVEASAPDSVPFGDPVVLRVTVSANPDEVDVSSIRVTEPLAPMTQLGATRVSRSSRGPLDVVTYEVTAACMEQRCVAARGPAVLRLPRIRVSAETADGVAGAGANWPEITVRGRVPTTVRDSTGRFQTDLDPPRITYRSDPQRSSTLLFVLAGVLAALAVAIAAVLTVRLVRRRNDIPLTEVERALLLARQSEARPPADRRRAVGFLARVLAPREPPLADEASTLAWSAPEPAGESVSSLVDDVGRTVGVR